MQLPKRNLKYLVGVLALCLLGFGVYQWLKPYSPHIKLTSKEEQTMNTLFSEVKTRCIGRYLVDLPVSFTPKEPTYSALINGSGNAIKTMRMYPPSFAQKIRLREQALRHPENPVAPENQPFLKHVHSLPHGMKGVIFERNESEGTPDVARILEAHLYLNGVAIEVTLKARNGLAKRYDEKRARRPNSYQNHVPQKLKELTHLLQRMQARDDLDIPTQAGVCMPNLFIADDPRTPLEDFHIYNAYQLSKNPNFYIGFVLDTDIQETDTLLDRGNGITYLLTHTNGKTLQKGPRNFKQFIANEWLMEKDDTRSDYREQIFSLFVNEQSGTPRTPFLRIKLKYRWNETPRLYSDAESIAIWEKITDTLRYRPGAFLTK